MQEKKKMEFYFGNLGACMPLFVLVGFLMTIAISGKVSLVLFCVAGFAALSTAFILAKDKTEFEDAVVEGIKDNTLCVIIFAFLLAGILSQELRQSGLIEGLTWLTTSLNLDARFFPLIAFLTCSLISTACGTSNGAIVAVLPIMLPLAVSLGADPAVMVGAHVSGAIFGDNLSPISDTTIASAVTQGAELKDVVRTRLPYSLIAGAISSVLFIYFGFKTASPAVITEIMDPSVAKTLVLLLIPVLMIFLMLKGWNLIATLMLCDLAGIVICVAFGFISLADMVSATGPIGAGMGGMLNVILFSMLIFAMLEMLGRSGILDLLLGKALKMSKTPRQAEIICAIMSFVGSWAIGAASINILFIGPMSRKILAQQNIAKTRGSNILDGISTSLAGIVPYNPVGMNTISLTLASGVVAESFSFLDYVPYCFHSILLFILFTLSIITGIGRTFEKN